MTDAMSTTEPIISTNEARKLIGKYASARLTDDQVEDIINQLDFMATLAIRDYKMRKVSKPKESK
jgi:hypothetical protein